MDVIGTQGLGGSRARSQDLLDKVVQFYKDRGHLDVALGGDSEFTARLKSLNEAEAAAKQALEELNLGTSAKIFLKEAEALKTLAENDKVAADKYAASVRSAADEYVSKAHQSADAMRADAANAYAVADEARKTAVAARDAAEASTKKADQALADARARAAEHEAKRDEYNKKIAALQGAVREIVGKVVG